MQAALFFRFVALASASPEVEQRSLLGDYLCTTVVRAGVTSVHLERAGPPSAFASDDAPTRFKMRITPNNDTAKPFRVVEIPYEGADRDPYEWQDENSVLHDTYYGDEGTFRTVGLPAFLDLYGANPGHPDGDIEFYHAGYELPGGEDTQLAVRWGRCRFLGKIEATRSDSPKP